MYLAHIIRQIYCRFSADQDTTKLSYKGQDGAFQTVLLFESSLHRGCTTALPPNGADAMLPHHCLKNLEQLQCIARSINAFFGLSCYGYYKVFNLQHIFHFFFCFSTI